MKKALWIRKNAYLFRHAGEELKDKSLSSALLYGSFAVPLTAFFKNLFPSISVSAVISDDADSEIASLMGADHISSSLDERKYDLVFAPFTLSLTQKEALVPLLYNLSMNLKSNGFFYTSFFKSAKIELDERKMRAFWDEDKEMKIKYYTAEDVTLAFSTLGLTLYSIEEDEVGKEKVVTAIFMKK